jgi:hypothetical protein
MTAVVFARQRKPRIINQRPGSVEIGPGGFRIEPEMIRWPSIRRLRQTDPAHGHEKI